MPDFNPQALTAMRRNLAGMGQDHLHIGADGGMRTTTGSAVGRFFGRVAALLSGSRAADNRTTIDNFLRQLEAVSGVGAGFANFIRGGLGAGYLAGKPLSARTATQIVDSAIERARATFVQKITVPANIADTVARCRPDDLIKSCAGMAVAGLGLSQEELEKATPDIQRRVCAELVALTETNGGKTPTEADVAKALRHALMQSYLDLHGAEQVNVVKGTLGYKEADTGKIIKQMQSSIAAVMDEFDALHAAKNRPDVTPEYRGLITSCASDLVRTEYNLAYQAAARKFIDQGGSMLFDDRVLAKANGLAPGVELGKQAVDQFSSQMLLSLRYDAVDKAVLEPIPTYEKFRELLDGRIAGYFADIEKYAEQPDLTPAESAAMIRSMVGNLSRLRPDTFNQVRSFQALGKSLFQSLGACVTDEDMGVLLRAFEQRSSAMQKALEAQGIDYEKAGMMLTLGLEAALFEGDSRSLLGRLASPHSHFLNEMRKIATQAKANGRELPYCFEFLLGALHKQLNLVAGPGNSFGENLTRFDREANRSLRDLENPCRTDALDVVAPEYLSEIMDDVRTFFSQSVLSMGTYVVENTKIPYPSEFTDPNDTRWEIASVFEGDVKRNGMLVDGKMVKSGKEFLDELPTRREAAQISRAFHQGIGAMIHKIYEVHFAQIYELLFSEEYLPFMQNVGDNKARTKPQSQSVSSLGGGAYRVSYTISDQAITPPPLPLPSGLLMEITGTLSFTIQTGDQPTFSDFDFDMVAYQKK